MEGGTSPGMGQIAARTDALVSRPETGKMAASIVPISAGWHPAMLRKNVHRCHLVRSENHFSQLGPSGLIIAACLKRSTARATKRSYCSAQDRDRQFAIRDPEKQSDCLHSALTSVAARSWCGESANKVCNGTSRASAIRARRPALMRFLSFSYFCTWRRRRWALVDPLASILSWDVRTRTRRF